MAGPSSLFYGISPENQVYMTRDIWADLIVKDTIGDNEADLAGRSSPNIADISEDVASARKASLEEVIKRIKSDPRESSKVIRKRIERIKGELAKIYRHFDLLRDRRDLSDVEFMRKRGKSKNEGMDGKGRWRGKWGREDVGFRKEGEGPEGGWRE